MITYVRDDVEAVAELLAEQVLVLDDRDLGRRDRAARAGSATPAGTC